ncbi:hypothetical protein C8R45DRAFT_941348 [Mycena sanguinolenta]|nr:hypothetical protein C8R45DRAFT_941348 [Mycena sanguinolenta]
MTLRDIHCLPNEILSDIFRLAVDATTPPFWQRSPPPRLFAELKRIENASLLTLSRVCPQWHQLALNNPTFWSNVEVNSVIGEPPLVLRRTLDLLNVRLARTRDAPLAISLIQHAGIRGFHPRILHLLAQHSERWESVRILNSGAESLQELDTAVVARRGGLPRLTKFDLNIRAPTAEFPAIAAAPRLATLRLNAPQLRSLSFAEILRHNPLQVLRCGVASPEDFAVAVALLPKLPSSAEFHFVINIDYDTDLRAHTSMCLPSITAHIAALGCSWMHDSHAHQMPAILEHVLASLTLPKLGQFHLACNTFPHLLLQWPHAQFLALSDRSDFVRCLKTLRIAEARISKDDLLEILSVLAVLEHLEVGDAPERLGRLREVVDKREGVLISNSFLRAMTCQPEQACFVPRLRCFSCVSRLAFTPRVLEDFVTSRVTRLAHSGSIILFDVRIHLCYSPTSYDVRRQTEAVRVGLWELAAQAKFVYQVGEEYISTE